MREGQPTSAVPAFGEAKLRLTPSAQALLAREAKAGTHPSAASDPDKWIPAFAGMTLCVASLRENGSSAPCPRERMAANVYTGRPSAAMRHDDSRRPLYAPCPASCRGPRLESAEGKTPTYGVISIGVPSGTMSQILTIATLPTAMHPSVQSRYHSGGSYGPYSFGMPCTKIAPPGSTPI